MRYHQPQVGLDQLLLGALGLHVAAADDLQRAPQLRRRGAELLLQVQHPLAVAPLLLAQVLHAVGAVRRPAFQLALHRRDLALERLQLVHRRADVVDELPHARRLWNLMVRTMREVCTISRPSSHSSRRCCFGFMPRGIAMQLLPALQRLLILPADLVHDRGEFGLLRPPRSHR